MNIPRLASDREIISKWTVSHYLLIKRQRQKLILVWLVTPNYATLKCKNKDSCSNECTSQEKALDSSDKCNSFCGEPDRSSPTLAGVHCTHVCMYGWTNYLLYIVKVRIQIFHKDNIHMCNM